MMIKNSERSRATVDQAGKVTVLTKVRDSALTDSRTATLTAGRPTVNMEALRKAPNYIFCHCKTFFS